MKITYLNINNNTSDLDNTTNLKNMKHINPKSYQLDKNYNNVCFDLDKLFKSIDITEKEVIDILSKCWFWDQNIRPKCTK